jgi:hypothetical protein
MAGLVAAIHVLGCPSKVVDGRDKPGHDGRKGRLRKLNGLGRWLLPRRENQGGPGGFSMWNPHRHEAFRMPPIENRLNDLLNQALTTAPSILLAEFVMLLYVLPPDGAS